MNFEGFIWLFLILATCFAVGRWSHQRIKKRKKTWQEFAKECGWRFEVNAKEESLSGDVDGRAVRLSVSAGHDSPGLETGRLKIELGHTVPPDSKRATTAVKNLQQFFSDCRTTFSGNQLCVEGVWSRIGRDADELRRAMTILVGAASVMEGRLARDQSI